LKIFHDEGEKPKMNREVPKGKKKGTNEELK